MPRGSRYQTSLWLSLEILLPLRLPAIVAQACPATQSWYWFHSHLAQRSLVPPSLGSSRLGKRTCSLCSDPLVPQHLLSHHASSPSRRPRQATAPPASSRTSSHPTATRPTSAYLRGRRRRGRKPRRCFRGHGRVLDKRRIGRTGRVSDTPPCRRPEKRNVQKRRVGIGVVLTLPPRQGRDAVVERVSLARAPERVRDRCLRASPPSARRPQLDAPTAPNHRASASAPARRLPPPRQRRPAPTSGKSTQKAFMLRPYRNAAKLSLKRARLSCSSCRCIRLASRSAMPSASSANAGSSAASGAPASCCEAREGGRSGVVGREGGRVREAERRCEVEGVVAAMARWVRWWGWGLWRAVVWGGMWWWMDACM